MEHTTTDGTLTVRLESDFNWMAVQQIEPLAADAKRVHIDLSAARLIDTEALMLIDRLQRASKTVRLHDPPPLLHDLIDMLELQSVFDVDTLVP